MGVFSDVIFGIEKTLNMGRVSAPSPFEMFGMIISEVLAFQSAFRDTSVWDRGNCTSDHSLFF